MLKKLLITAAVAATASVSINSFAACYYAGPSIGILDSITNSGSFRGIVPRLTIGYGDMDDSYYFAGEIFLTPTSIALQDAKLPGTLSTKPTREIGASFVPGLVIGPQTVGFGRLGIVTTRFIGPNVYKTGGQVGLGLMTPVSPSWDLRGEYDFNYYGSVSQIGAPRVDEFNFVLLYRFEG